MYSFDVFLLLYLFLNNVSVCKFFKIFKMLYNDGNFDKIVVYELERCKR